MTTRIVNNDTCHVPKNRVLLYISVVLKSDHKCIHYMWLEVPIPDKIKYTSHVKIQTQTRRMLASKRTLLCFISYILLVWV